MSLGGIATGQFCGQLAENLESINSKLKKSSKICKFRRIHHNDSNCKDINTEDVGVMIPCGWQAAMDAALDSKATYLTKLREIQIWILNIQQDIQDLEEKMIQIPNIMTLMLMIQWSQHHVVDWLSWIHYLLWTQIIQQYLEKFKSESKISNEIFKI